ncbi:MAG: hypothetical protein ACRECH_09860 [Nitrososphaerales archaeon]
MLRIHRRVGQNSKIAGIVLAILSLVFLVLSIYFSNNIVFQIDSVISLLAAIAVFLRGERSSMQIRIVNRMLDSSTQALNEMSSFSFGPAPVFSYVPLGKKLVDVVVVANTEVRQPSALEASTDGGATMSPQQSNILQKTLVPPGRSLAELYARELGVVISMDALIQSLRNVICERFELASSLSVKQSEGNLIEVTLSHPAVRQSCTTAPTQGIVGCPLSSMLAVLFCHASNRIVSLEQCVFQGERDALEISLGLGPR